MPRPQYWRALAVAATLLASTPVSGIAATPTPSPSPTPAPACTTPPGMQGDPQEQTLYKQCQAEQAKIQTEKSKLSDNLALAQSSSDSLQQMLQQTRDAITANHHLQDQTQADISALEVQEAETSRQIDATRRRLSLRRSEFADYLRRTYKYQPDLLDSIFESKA